MKSFNDCDLLQMWEQKVTVGASNREMAKEASQPSKLGVHPNLGECFHNTTHSCIHFGQNQQHQTQLLLARLMGSKCLLGRHSITHLDFHYSAEGVTPSGDKTKAIVERSVPKSAKEVRSFLGFATFTGFANISVPLNDLTSKKIAFKSMWYRYSKRAF